MATVFEQQQESRGFTTDYLANPLDDELRLVFERALIEASIERSRWKQFKGKKHPNRIMTF